MRLQTFRAILIIFMALAYNTLTYDIPHINRVASLLHNTTIQSRATGGNLIMNPSTNFHGQNITFPFTDNLCNVLTSASPPTILAATPQLVGFYCALWFHSPNCTAHPNDGDPALLTYPGIGNFTAQGWPALAPTSWICGVEEWI
ncbi:hypothetical protein M433DRAFT_158448 [Acidomyces richmondensis BFW]|nr:MAG: hypothetical protein FE78DRAFT_84102 [Acidomyces sp. 'richmondensis']KYG41970.1 hypothetical protein M433DRAFT_158448 [Acidomyces richmondensis BFW]